VFAVVTQDMAKVRIPAGDVSADKLRTRRFGNIGGREQALYKPIPIDEELAAEVDEVLNQRVREAVQWLKTHPDR
jgi:hypothetical protein